MIRIGTAGWSIPRASAFRFDATGTHLSRYSRELNCVEINSSFHRPHSAATYAKWRDLTPPDFRFSVKAPRIITHDLKLRQAREPFVAFLIQSDGLGSKRGPILVQLPPSHAFEADVVISFLEMMRAHYDGPVVCEPRHASWFTPEVDRLLQRYRVSRVVADPPPVPAATVAGGWQALQYVRLHGQPRTYWSRYDEDYLDTLANRLRHLTSATEWWCVFDNTAGGAALENAWDLRARWHASVPARDLRQQESLGH